ncbi:MAG TPA: POTRA domain-containing protein [Thermoguttaceae bacterium]|nr:POTRA domain-containing protein [Thermoguttaceae bacterium]
MAMPRIVPRILNHLWLAMLLGVGIYGSAALFGQGVPAWPVQEKVVEVRVEGNRTIPTAKILPKIRTRADRPFDADMVVEDVRRLNRTRMFVNVETFSQQVPGGRVVVFRVIERPTLLSIRYVGNQKIKTSVLTKEISDKIGLKEGDSLDPFAVEEARRKIEDYYHSKGFSSARVTIQEGDETGDRNAIFLINEGQKQKILWTGFVGNAIASDARLRTQIQSKPPTLYLFKGEVDKKQIEEDEKRLIAYYRGLGYFSARVGHELEFNDSGTWATLTFVIDEGPRSKVREVSFIGNGKFSTEQLAADLKLRANHDFNQAKMNGDVAMISEKYGSVGYIFADVKADIRFFEEPGELAIVYNIAEGNRYRVGKINVVIKGEYPHTQVATVLDRLSMKPGEIVDIRKIRESERRLRRSGLFEINPQAGTAPKIVFSPPDPEEMETQMARPPQHGPDFRGQSPDVIPTGGWQYAASADSRAGDERIDLYLPCERVPANTPPPASPGPQVPRVLPAPSAPPVPPSAYFPRQSSGPNGSAPMRSEMTVRFQDGFDSDGGWSVPDFRPRMPGTSDQPVTMAPNPAYGNPAYGNPADGGLDAPVYRVGAVPTPLPDREGIFSENSPFFGGPATGDMEPTVPLPFDVIAHETQTGRLMFGVGVNSDAGLVGSLVIDEQNFNWARWPNSWEDIRNATAFRGAGQRLRLEAVPGTLVQRYMFTWQDPYFMHTQVGLGVSGYFYDRRYREWDEEQLGGRVSLGYQFTPDLSGSFAFRGAKINIHDPVVTTLPELNEVVGDNALYGFRAQLTHDTRDSAFLATEGHLFQASFEQVIGTFAYPRAELDLSRYFLIHQRPDESGRHVLSLSARVGITGSDTPIYEHYYAGGFSTIRGFDYRGASPRDAATGVLVGGEFQLLASAQYMFPITADDMLRAVVFCDAGTVVPTIDQWDQDYRVAPGFGLRIMIPAMGPAPIALDFAFPVSSEPGDRREVFSFFVGFNH